MQTIVVFGKTARPGEVKTRMTPALSPQQAAKMYGAFGRDVLETAARYAAQAVEAPTGPRQVSRVLAWDGQPDDPLAEYAHHECGFEVVDQGGGDLGDRMRRIVSDQRDRGAEEILIIGSDSPTLSPEHLKTARLLLDGNDVVFGPSFDGGYYLVGIDLEAVDDGDVLDGLFDDIPWSTTEVMNISWKRAVERGLLCDLLGFWYDIDTCEDLAKARFHLCQYLGARDSEVGRHTRQLLETERFKYDDTGADSQ